MPEDFLATYLNDHLAGSEMALELLEFLEKCQPECGLAQTSPGLRAEIAADRRQLEELMDQWDVSKSSPRQALAWLSEKMMRLKLRVDDPSQGALWILEIIEVISLGIEGKRALWRSLRFAAQRRPQLNEADYERLELRAEKQRALVESFREAAALAALAPEGGVPRQRPCDRASAR